MQTLPLAHAAVTLILVGLIWTIQLVHYPLFRYVDPKQWAAFHGQHARRITWLVALLMPLELAFACLLVLQRPAPAPILGLLLALAIWVCTALVQVPLHARLAEGLDPAVHQQLVRSNWIRTVLWTLRGVLAVLLLLPPGSP